MNKGEATDFCTLFLEKLEKLERLPFTEFMRMRPTSFTLSFNRDPEDTWSGESVLDVPTEGDIDAFLLTFRLFHQEGGECQIQKLAAIYESLDLSEPNRTNFRIQMRRFRDYLRSTPNFSVEGIQGLERATRKKVLDVFIFGDLAHPAEYRPLILRLREMPMANDVLFFIFVGILMTVLNFLVHVGRPAAIGAIRDLHKLP